MNTKKDRLSHRLSDIRCESCDEEFDIRRYELGYNFCLSCGDVLARSVVRTVVPLHKSNYVLVTNRDDLKGINSKYQPT